MIVRIALDAELLDLLHHEIVHLLICGGQILPELRRILRQVKQVLEFEVRICGDPRIQIRDMPDHCFPQGCCRRQKRGGRIHPSVVSCAVCTAHVVSPLNFFPVYVRAVNRSAFSAR